MFQIRVPRAGLSYSEVYEWRETARWHQMEWADFCELDGDDQSALVAHYQTHRQIEAVLTTVPYEMPSGW